MGSPNFAKPKYATGIAFMPSFEFSEDDINDVIEANGFDGDDAESIAESILIDSDNDYISEQVEYCEQTLEKLKVIVDDALIELLPNISSMEDELVDEWFKIKKEYGYHEGVGFTIEPSDIIYSHAEDYAEAYWELACESLDTDKISHDEMRKFFELVQSAYSYMMAITGFNYGMVYILGGWCGNSSQIKEKPMPDEVIANLKLVEDINTALAETLEAA